MGAYGHLQRTLTRHVGDLLSLGITDMRPAIMPRRFGEGVQAVGAHIGAGRDADRATYERVLGLSETVAAWCDELAAAGGQLSLDHNDLHPWNILTTRADGTGRMKFYDWGDSVIAHPFASMLVPLGYMQNHSVSASTIRAFCVSATPTSMLSPTSRRTPNSSGHCSSPAA
jgi:Phosphotransferase enzyme family